MGKVSHTTEGSKFLCSKSSKKSCHAMAYTAFDMHENKIFVHSECVSSKIDWGFEQKIEKCEMACKRTKIWFSCICHHTTNLLR